MTATVENLTSILSDAGVIETDRLAARRRPGAMRMIITGWTEEIPREHLEELGVCALITKPWDDAKLKATLRRALTP